MQNIHSATKDFEAAQRAEREAFIQVIVVKSTLLYISLMKMLRTRRKP